MEGNSRTSSDDYSVKEGLRCMPLIQQNLSVFSECQRAYMPHHGKRLFFAI